MRNLALLRPGACMVTAATLVMGAAAVAFGGIQPCSHEARFGLLGLAPLQTARLSVINLQPSDPIVPPDPVHPPGPATAPPDPCHVAIGFLTTDNQLFTTADGAPVVLERDLWPGESAFVELRSSDAFRGSRQLRAVFRPTGLFTHSPPPDDSEPPPDDGATDACSAVVATLEIYDVLTGRPQIVEQPFQIVHFQPRR